MASRKKASTKEPKATPEPQTKTAPPGLDPAEIEKPTPEEAPPAAEEKPYIEMYLSKSRYLQEYGAPRPRLIQAAPTARVKVRLPRYITRAVKEMPEKGKLADPSKTKMKTILHPEDAHLKYADPGDVVDVRPGVRKTGMPISTSASPIVPPGS